MTTEIIKITDRDAWLKQRVKDITSTEVSALYGLSPYKSEFELFHEKRDQVVVNIDPNERMKWGTRLESAIAHGVAEDMGWPISKMDVYMRNLEVRMGSSFDFQVLESERGPGILEIKNVDWLAYRQSWVDDGDGNIEGPAHIELQVQHQLEVSDFEWAAIAVLVGGNETKVVLRNRDREIGADIRAKVSEFWERVNANRPPSPDYSKDAEYIIKNLAANAKTGDILQADEELESLIEKYRFCAKTESDMKDQKKIWQAQILERIGSASKVVTNFGSLSCGVVKGRAGTLITPEMVGATIGATDGYRGFRFYAKGETA
jgi:putative phage-type endonuclease